MAGPLTDAQVLDRLRRVRSGVAEGLTAREVAARCGLLGWDSLRSFLRKRMGLLYWPPKLEALDALIGQIEAGEAVDAKAPAEALPRWSPSSRQLEVIGMACAAYGVDLQLVRTPGRARRVSRARQAAAWVLCQAWPKLSISAVGTFLGMSDHSSAVYARNKAEDRRGSDAGFRDLTDMMLAAALGSGPVAIPDAVARQIEQVNAAAEDRRLRKAALADALDACGVDAGDCGSLQQMAGMALHTRRIMNGSQRMAQALGAKPMPTEGRARVWCAQCDRRVTMNEAAGCGSSFCAAKAAIGTVAA